MFTFQFSWKHKDRIRVRGVQLSADGAPQSLLSTLLPRESRGITGRQLVWVRRHVASELKAADFDSRLAALGLIRPEDALAAPQIRKRLAANNIQDHHHTERLQHTVRPSQSADYAPAPHISLRQRHHQKGSRETVKPRTSSTCSYLLGIAPPQGRLVSVPRQDTSFDHHVSKTCGGNHCRLGPSTLRVHRRSLLERARPGIEPTRAQKHTTVESDSVARFAHPRRSMKWSLRRRTFEIIVDGEERHQPLHKIQE